MIRRPPRSTQSRSSAASDVYKRQVGPQRLGLHVADRDRLLEPPHCVDGHGQREDDEEEEKDESEVVDAQHAERTRAALCHLAGEDEREREKNRRATDLSLIHISEPTR